MSGYWWNIDGKGAKKRKAPLSWDTEARGNAAARAKSSRTNAASSGATAMVNAAASTFQHLYRLAQVSPSATMSDVTFIVGAGVCARSRKFHAHRCIVAAWSRPLRARMHAAVSAAAAAVSSSFARASKHGKAARKEAGGDNEDAAVRAALQRASVHSSGFAGGLRVQLPSVDPSTFALLLRFMYTGSVGAQGMVRGAEVGGAEGGSSAASSKAKAGTDMQDGENGVPFTLSHTMSLLALAFDLEVLALRDYCHSLLMREDTFPARIENGSAADTFRLYECGFILRFADRHAIPVLAKRCILYIAANIGDMVCGSKQHLLGRPPICDLEDCHLKLVLEEIAMRFSGTAFGAKMALTATLTWLQWRFKQPLHSQAFLQDSKCPEYADLLDRVEWRCISERNARDIISQFDIAQVITRQVLSHVGRSTNPRKVADTTGHVRLEPMARQIQNNVVGDSAPSGDHDAPIIVEDLKGGGVMSFVPLLADIVTAEKSERTT